MGTLIKRLMRMAMKDEAQQTSILQLGSKLATVTAKLNLPV